MKTTMLAFAAAVGLGMGSAAASEDGALANTQFTELPGVLAQAPAQISPLMAMTQNGQAVQAYVTQSQRGTSVFPPNEYGNG